MGISPLRCDDGAFLAFFEATLLLNHIVNIRPPVLQVAH